MGSIYQNQLYFYTPGMEPAETEVKILIYAMIEIQSSYE